MSRSDFSAPWSKYLTVVSAAVSVLLVGIAIVLWWSVRDTPGIQLGLASLVLLILAGCVLFVIRGYRLDGAQLYVRRLLWETAVDLRDLESAVRDPSSLQGSIKLFGNGGLFSVSGIFWNKKLGRYRAFVTDHTNAVVLKIAGGTIVISPGEPERLVEELLNSHPQVRRSAEHPMEAAL